jgi:hypothetical protein
MGTCKLIYDQKDNPNRRKIMQGPKFVMSAMLLALLALALLIVGCAGLFQWNSKSKAEIQTIATDMAPVIAGAEKLMGNIQVNYNFYALLAQGVAQIAGVKVTPDMVILGKQVAQIADDGLKLAGPIDAAVKSGQTPTLDVASTTQTIADIAAAFPQAVAKAMQNPGVAALYQVYLAQQVSGIAPVAAPAVPTS